MRLWSMGLVSLAGLFGAAGVALAAIGAHRSGDPIVTTAAYFLLFHASAIIALCAFARPTDMRSGERAVLAGASLIAFGTFLFSGELALHGLAGLTPLPLAAPTGGLSMIAGWLVAALALPASLRR